MGHQEALKKKIQLGQCRLLMDPDVRQDQALEWLAAWGFSTSAILIKLYLSKADFPEMRKKSLILSKLIDVSITSNSRATQMRIIYLSAKGRAYLRKKNGPKQYMPPREPASLLRHHNYLCQVAAASFIVNTFPDSISRWMGPYSLTAGALRHDPPQDFADYVPDYYLLDRTTNKRYFFELERASTIDRYLKEKAAASRKSEQKHYSVDAESAATLSRFFRKLECLSKLGSVKIIFANPAALKRAEGYLSSLLEIGIPKVWKEGRSWRVWEGEYDKWTGKWDNIEWLNLADVVDPSMMPGAKS